MLARRRCRSKAEKKRCGGEGWREGGSGVRRGDAFILPTGNYPNNTCISSTPVAHRLSLFEGQRNEGRRRCRQSERDRRRVEEDGQGGEKYNKLRPRERRNNRDNSGIDGLCYTPKARRKAILIFFSISRFSSCSASRYTSSISLPFFLLFSHVFPIQRDKAPLRDTAVTHSRVFRYEITFIESSLD